MEKTCPDQRVPFFEVAKHGETVLDSRFRNTPDERSTASAHGRNARPAGKPGIFVVRVGQTTAGETRPQEYTEARYIGYASLTGRHIQHDIYGRRDDA